MPSADHQRLIDRARAILLEHLRHRETPTPGEGRPYRSYDELDDAIKRALMGDGGAVATLRRVFDEPGFAITNSLNEQGWASLGLALLGDRQSIQRIRGVLPINLNREARPLALAILDADDERAHQ